MTDIVTRLRNWRTVHLARLHLLMEEAAEEMERLRADWPEQLAAARSEIDHLRNGALDGRETVRQGLSEKNHCPDADNAATQDTVGSILARRITGLQPMLEYREQIAILRADNNRRADLEVGLREGVEKLQADVRRLEAVIAAGESTLTDAERKAVEWAVAAASNFDHPAEDTLRGLLERL